MILALLRNLNIYWTLRPVIWTISKLYRIYRLKLKIQELQKNFAAVKAVEEVELQRPSKRNVILEIF